jgi:NTP pyrophosphatase (non-canonical NTP hydrolase)
MTETHAELVSRLKQADFDKIAERMATPQMIDIQHAITGICTEGAGELSDALKRHLFYGTEFDFVNVKEEVGDLLWYVELLCQACGFTMEEAKELNVKKLTKRFGTGGFTEEAAINRDTEAERVVLEDKVIDMTKWVENTGIAPLSRGDEVPIELIFEDGYVCDTTCVEAWDWGLTNQIHIIKGWRFAR